MASSAFSQKWRESLEGGQPSDQAENQGRQSEAQALCSSSGRHQPCQGCLAKAAELRDVMASLELVQVRSRAAVDRCNKQQTDLERRRDYTGQLERSLEEAKAEVGRIQASMQQLERENLSLLAQLAGRASSSAAAAMLQNLAAAAATATAAATAAGGGMGAEQGVVNAPPVDDDLGTAFIRRQLEDACTKAVFAQRALDPERGFLQMGDELGAGGHGTVRKAVDPTTGKTYAVKTANDEEGKACLKEEAKNLIRLGVDEGVVEVMAILDKDSSMAIAMELGQTDLQHAMFDQKRTVVELLTYAAQVADGVDFMHGKGLVHGDVKPDNVVLVKKSETLTVAKLADLGLSRAVGERKYRGCGTLGNSITPNNYFEEVPADKADDVWALGVLLLSLLLPRGLFSSNFLTSRVLHTAAEREALARSTTSRQRLEIKFRMSSRTANDTSENGFQKRMIRGMLFVTLEQTMRDTACDFLRRMVDPDASKRPDIGEVRAWLPSIIQSAERQTAVTAAAALVPTTPSPPPRLPLSRGGSVSTISFSSSGGSSDSSSSSSSAARTSDSASSPSAGSAPSAGGSVESFSSSASRSGRLAVVLEDEAGMAVSGQQEDATPNPPAAATVATAAAAITPSMAGSTSAEAAGGDNSAPDSWMPSHDGASLALGTGAAESVQDGVAHNSGSEDAWSTGTSSVSGIDAAVGINSSADISQQQVELSSNVGSVRFFSGAGAAGATDGLLLPLVSGGGCSTSGSRQARGDDGEATVDADGWSEPVAVGCVSVEGIVDGNGSADAGTSSAVDVTLTLTPAVSAMVAEEGPTGDGTFGEHWAVGGSRECLGSGEWGEAAATGPRQRPRLGTFLNLVSEGPPAAATAGEGAVGASSTMTAPPPIVPGSFAFEGAGTAGGQEPWAIDLGMAAAGAGGWGIDLWVTALAPLPQDVFAPEVNMAVQCGRYGRRRRRLPCFASLH
ncbi:probable serine/threonine-protein kinase transcriptional regulatoryprotein pknk [Ectocarpus siliculosus]|uniref:Probable serine/threonine-protein kinase transcriptional regulatoryprotein pknk n=1 Tax=Ectocarpus siliculosus TaxID=2880 RepID=D7FX32_ECTSI|nr:probable serine/threonine-protein kinase transcriptional regulatoryprotein pknk [Ectocarpus siliculosus]|eukprot:CBJ26365.1 probable serine/threonine-protein kinase transcriptional regulatoryprotein pknk [Ectocarpus siliculosus]